MNNIGFRQSIVERFNEISARYVNALSIESFSAAFSRAGMSNQPQLQNDRVKAISSLPVDYTKQQIGEFLRNPYSFERPIRETSEILRWTNYPYFKILKTYADIPTDRYYAAPKYITKEDAKKPDFEREAMLVDKLNKEIRPEITLHRIRMKALLQGKCICATRYEVDKSHNKVNYAFLEELPTDWCYIIGRNNISGWTVSFDMMYFLTPGTDVGQYGDLFAPYMDSFNRMFDENIVPRTRQKGSYVYSSAKTKIKKGKNEIAFYPENIEPESPGNPQLFQQNGTWAYYVSLPIDRVWVYQIDDSTPAILPPLAGMMLTYAQQADFEEIQKALYTNPLVKIFTGEIPYFNDDGTRTEDTYKLSDGARMLFQVMFEQLMARTNTAGTAFFSAPVQNIKSHDFSESANANGISTSFGKYAGMKSGLAALIPVDEDIKAGQVEAAKMIESRYATACIYPQFERMMSFIYSTLNLRYEWEFKIFGTIFDEEKIRKNATSQFVMGDLSALFVLSAIDGMSWLDKKSMLYAMNASELLDLFVVPQTAYTAGANQSKDKATQTAKKIISETGRPQTEGISSESKEKSIDAGVSEVN